MGVNGNAGPLLLRAGLITQAQLKTAYEAVSSAGGTLTEYLVGARIVDEERLCNFFRERLMVPRIGIAELQRLSRKVTQLLPSDMAAEFRAVPVEIDHDQNLALAMADPSDTHATDEIHFFTGLTIMRVVAPPSAIAWALRYYYNVMTPLAELTPQATPLPLPAPERTGPVNRIAPPPEAKAAVVTISDTARKRKLPPAQIVDDVYDMDTPLPKPIPFDETTGNVMLVDPASLGLAQLSVKEVPLDLLESHDVITDIRTVSVAPHAAPTVPDTPTALGVNDPEEGVATLLHPLVDSIEGAHPEADAALEDALGALAEATDRDGVAAALVAYLRRLSRRAAFFVLRRGELSGFVGNGLGIHLDTLREATLPLEKPSTFRDVVSTRLPFRGPVSDVASRDFLIDGLGWAPTEMLAVPISVRERVVGILYGDEKMHTLPDEHLAQVIRAAEMALERALMARKAQ